MSMNSFSNKMDQIAHAHSRGEKLDLGVTSDASDRDACPDNLASDSITSDELRQLREAPQNLVNLDELKKRYENISDLGRRSAPRFNAQVLAIVYTATLSFRTASVDLSETGACFRELLPENFTKEPLEILFVHENEEGQRQYLLFSGEAIGGPVRTPRVSFKSSAPQAAEALRGLLAQFPPLVAA